MSIGLNLGVYVKAYQSSQAADPITQYLDSVDGSEQAGIWYWDPNLCPCYQDVGGATPAISAGNAVARIDDYFENGVNITQSTAALQPTLVAVGSIFQVRHQADALSVAGQNVPIGTDGQGVQVIWQGADNTSTSNTATQMYWNGRDTDTGDRLILRREGGTGIRLYSLLSDPNNFADYTNGVDSTQRVIRARSKQDLPNRGLYIWDDEILVGNNAGGGGQGAWQINEFHIGRRQSGTEYHADFQWSAMVVIDRATVSDTTTEEIAALLMDRNSL